MSSVKTSVTAKKRGGMNFGKRSKNILREGVFAISLRSKPDGEPFGPWRWLTDFNSYGNSNGVNVAVFHSIDHRWWKRKLFSMIESKHISHILTAKNFEVKTITVWRKINQKLGL